MSIFKGAAVAIITPFQENGEINYPKLAEILDDQIANHTDAIVICGTTGESMLLSVAERKQVNGDKGLRMDSLRRSGSRLATSTASA